MYMHMCIEQPGLMHLNLPTHTHTPPVPLPSSTQQNLSTSSFRPNNLSASTTALEAYRTNSFSLELIKVWGSDCLWGLMV